MKSKINIFLNITILTALALTSCTSNKSVIATAVAMTVQAQNTQSSAVTDTPLALATIPPLTNTETANTPVAVDTSSANTSAASLSTTTPLPLVTQAATSNAKCYPKATYISETVPDGTIVSPGATFTKTWTIQNSGTCPWDSTWKLVFVSGDVMGAAYVFNIPQSVPPNQNIILPIVFTAPTAEGIYKGYWKLESPWGCVFGDSGGGGCSGNPYWVEINVNSGTPSKGQTSVYGVTSVTYKIVPILSPSGCSPNVFLWTYATISTNGPLKVTYSWSQSDGGHTNGGTLNFAEAGTQTVNDGGWALRVGHEMGMVWDQIVITSPVHQVFPNQDARYDHECN